MSVCVFYLATYLVSQFVTRDSYILSQVEERHTNSEAMF